MKRTPLYPASGKAVSRRRRVTVNALSFARMIRALLDGPCTFAELMEETGLSYDSVRLWMRELHRQGVVHLSSWVEDSRGRKQVRCFAFGPGRDAKRPPPLTDARKQALYAARQKARALPSIISGE